MKITDYKPHIDGLRALAVLPVIFFHADIDYFKGGFVGVDIFFVISGYLITNIIINDLSKNKFSLKHFYLRRARRILPVLFFVTIVSIFLAIVLMAETELKFFSKQAMSVALLISNFFFWKNTGYFDPNSELQPLLHTWSLGVEEQFYIFFPVFLIIVWKFFKKKLSFLIITIILFSFFLCQIGGNFKIQNISSEYPFFILPFEFFWQAGSANFYLPFGRVWELLAGSLVSIYHSKNKIDNKPFNNFYTIIGVILILFSILKYSDDLQYPSIFTTLPVIGTALLIIYSTKSTLTYKIFSYKPLVFLGLISFSLYLWHQPLLSFNRIYFGINLTLIHKLLIIFFTLFLSILTWRFIEKPFRNKKIIDNKKVILSISSASLLIVFTSALISSSKITTLQKPINSNILKSFQQHSPKNCFDLEYAHLNKRKWYCEVGAKTKDVSFAIIGDSHALALKTAFDEASKIKNKKGIFTGFSGCPGLLGVNSLRPDSNIRNCKLLNDKLYNFIKKQNIKQIFLVSRWSYYTVGNHAKNNFNLVIKENGKFSNKNISKQTIIYGIQNTIKKYKNLGVEIIFVHQVPEQIYDPKYAYKKSFNRELKKIDLKKLYLYGVDYKKHIDQQRYIKKNLKVIKDEYENFLEINFDDIFCDDFKCLQGTEFTSYYGDKNHLSINGSMKTINRIKDYLK